MDNYGITQEELSTKVGKSRSFIANMVRILALPDIIKEMIMEGKIYAGPARALLSLPDNETKIKFGNKIIKQKLSVRKTEDIVKRYTEEKKKEKKNNTKTSLEWEEKIIHEFGEKVKIESNSSGGGKLIIKYKNKEELLNLINKIKT